MKNFKNTTKILSLFLTLCLVFTLSVFPNSLFEANGKDLTPEEELAIIEQRIKETNKKLEELGKKSADTEEYLEVLNDKIGYLQKQLDYVTKQVNSDKKSINDLKTKYDENEKAIEVAKNDIVDLTEQLDAKTDDFNVNYDLYCKRLCAMYISGETNIISFLITSDDISELLTRFEMVRRISKQDGELLKTVRSEMNSIVDSRREITEKQNSLATKQTELQEITLNLEKSIAEMQEKQISLDKKRTALSSERAEANVLLKKLSDQKGYYTEYLEDNLDTMHQIDNEIAQAEKEHADKLTTTKPSTTKPPTTTKPNQGGGETSKPSTTKPTTKPEEQTKFIKLTYPVPSQKRITCGFHGYVGHSGADFSCPTGSRVVAAESGTVIISKDLTNPDGSYRSYGRYIVIKHDKTTPSGDSVYTLYAHNSRRLVSAGTYVEKGQQIAESGSTGNSTGPHCHFEVRTPSSSYSDCKDPAKYL